LSRHNPVMPSVPSVFSVQSADEESCAAELARLCSALQLVPILRPVRSPGTERWIARAMAAAPVDEDQGRAVG